MPKRTRSARVILGAVAVLALLLAALVFLPMAVFTVMAVRPVVWGLALIAGAMGALMVGIIMLRLARTGALPNARDKRALWAGAVGVAVGIVALSPAGARLSAAIRDPPLIAAMSSDLLNLVPAESLHYAVFGTHTADLSALDSVSWQPSYGVTVVFDRADRAGWSARALHRGTEMICTMSVERLADGSYEGRRPDCEER